VGVEVEGREAEASVGVGFFEVLVVEDQRSAKESLIVVLVYCSKLFLGGCVCVAAVPEWWDWMFRFFLGFVWQLSRFSGFQQVRGLE